MWIATDNGLNASDRQNWWSYRRDPDSGKGSVKWLPAEGAPEQFTTESLFAHNYILGISFRGDGIWLATEKGVSHGTPSDRSQAQVRLSPTNRDRPGMENAAGENHANTEQNGNPQKEN